MSNIDKQALREAAEKATPGKWRYLKTTPFMDAEISAENHTRVVNLLAGDVTLDNSEFIAAANPATVLALLDELEAKDKQIGDLKATAAHSNAGWKEAHEQEARAEAAEKRIAELEAREVREDGNQFLVVRHPGKAPVIKHCAGDIEGFLRQLLEHEPMATIDIVTHRYYGVGGQWVQDADEYLHMMTAAAGKGE
ncbi:ead/Ea22-like family protein [Enterobacter asburiae]|uniref:ead/Ea22-like family protein n=1 Tax=Enterobacter asburiae TaxID=61645 RepID=UPI0018C309D3|nr:ead/Ea22-like family protein [Enterobacter asburiae]MBG0639711.1 ead/Ea22-like family protein [Enterobacter asburiae]